MPLNIDPDLPVAGRYAGDTAIPLGIWAGSAAAVTAVFFGLAVSFFGGSLDQRILRSARPGVAPLSVADTVFQGPVFEGRSVANCDKDAVRNLTTALIDSNQFEKAAEELTEVAARCVHVQ